jgi:hypothetical protein
MNPILQISIPTYNRANNVNYLIGELIEYKISNNTKDVLIGVYDNSDVKNCELLEKSNAGLISYQWNHRNIGYAGNIKNCLTKSSAHYTWIISDDDDLNLSYLSELIEFLKKTKDNIVGVALPCIVEKLNDGRVRLDISLNTSKVSIIEFRDAVSEKRIPFDFISSLIIKTDIVIKSDVEKISSDNDYFHSLVFCNAIKTKDLIAIYDKALIHYKGPDSLRWSLMRLLKSKMEICQILNELHGIKIHKSEILYEVLKWAVFARSDLLEISTLENYRFKLIAMTFFYMSIKNVAISILLIFPKIITKIIVIKTIELKKTARDFKVKSKIC